MVLGSVGVYREREGVGLLPVILATGHVGELSCWRPVQRKSEDHGKSPEEGVLAAKSCIVLSKLPLM